MPNELACLEDGGQAQGRPLRRTGTRSVRAQPGVIKRGGLARETDHDNLTTLSLAEQAQRCAAEQQDYCQHLPGDGRVGLELFRRAIQQRDELAWELIYQQWKPLLLRWLLAHPWANWALEHGLPESYITAALGKFWQATTSAQRPRPDFATLDGVLAYLRCCLHSVVLDAVRQVCARQYEVLEEFAVQLAVNQQPEATGGELWRCIERALPNRYERRLIYLRYVQGYRPREVVAIFSGEFPSVEKLYKLERTILQRLSRHLRWLTGGSER